MIPSLSINLLMWIFFVFLQILTSISSEDIESSCHNITLSCNTTKELPASAKLEYVDEIEMCVYQFDNKETYKKAEEICKEYDLDVVTIKSLKHDKYIKMHIPEDTYRYWIGARQVSLPKLTYVESGLSVDEKQQNKPECGAISWARNGSKIDEVPNYCTLKRRFLCRKTDERCSSLDEKCLFFDSANVDAKTWFEARHYCTFNKGELFFMRKGEKISEVSSFLFANWPEKKDLIYIGLQHQKWLWNDGEEVIFCNWDLADPLTNECVQVRKGFWSSADCYETAFVVCSRDVNAIRVRCLQQQQAAGCPNSYLPVFCVLLFLTVVLAGVTVYLVKFKPPIE